MWVYKDKAWRSCKFSRNERFNEKEGGSKLNPFVEFMDTMYPQNPFQSITTNRVEGQSRGSREIEGGGEENGDFYKEAL